MNDEMKQHLIECLKAGARQDGRALDEFREITIDTDVSSTAEGSARLRCGKTEIIVGVKLGIGTPFQDRPDEGVLMVNAELLPIANRDYEAGPPSAASIELARVIDRGIRESKAIDVNKLCIEEGKKVWMVQIDVCPINADGNLIDLGTLASLAALLTARFPAVVDGMVEYKERTKERLELTAIPIALTVFKVGELLLVDPAYEEENASSARLTIIIRGKNEICGMQKGGAAPLTMDEVTAMIDLALDKSAELRGHLEGLE